MASSGFPTWSDTNQAVELQKMAQGLAILDLGSRGIVLSISVAKTKVLISFAVTAELICVFVFAYTKRRFSHDAAHMMLSSFSFQKVKKSATKLVHK